MLGSVSRFVSVAGVCALVGCATVSVRKVPSPNQYMVWTDQMQAEADRMEGLRFYMPRPYVNVFESFPVRTDVYLAQGIVSPDSDYVVLVDVIPERDFDNFHAAGVLNDRYRVPTRMISTEGGGSPGVTRSGASSGGVPIADAESGALGRYVGREVLLSILSGETPLQVSADGIDGAGLAEILKGYWESKKAAEQTEKEKLELVSKLEPGDPTGVTGIRASTDPDAVMHHKLRGNFDIVYLPDFDEQYVVNGTANLGNANVALRLGQGWSLQGLDAMADNREINRRIFDLFDTAVQIAKTAAFGELGFMLPGTGGAASSATATADAESGGAGHATRSWAADQGLAPGARVTLKFVVVHYAAKGLYPVLKPRELRPRFWNVDSDPYHSWGNTFGRGFGRHYGVLDLFKLFPHRTPASIVGLDFTPPHDEGGRLGDAAPPDHTEREIEGNWLNVASGQSSIPVYPYQYVSFNTFRYVAIEAIQANDDSRNPFEHVYPGTGTDESKGIARTVIPVRSGGDTQQPQQPQQPGNANPPANNRSIATVLRDLLEAAEFDINGWKFQVDYSGLDGKIVKVDLQDWSAQGTGDEPSEQDRKAAVTTQLPTLLMSGGISENEAKQYSVQFVSE